MKKISANCYRGEKITSLNDVGRLADEKKSIYHYCWGLKPARALCMMQYQSLYNEIQKGKLFYVINSKDV